VGQADRWRKRARRMAHRWAIRTERAWDTARPSRRARHSPKHFRIDAYLGHGSGRQVVIRGRVLDNRDPRAAVDGEGTWTAVHRTALRFLTNELPDVPLRVSVGSVEAETVSDEEGYFEIRLNAEQAPFTGPWAAGEVSLARPYRGIDAGRNTPLRVRVAGSDAAFGVISDIDDTILHTGAQRALDMIRQTLTGSELTRVPFAGAPELYYALEGQGSGGRCNPIFYVSSSPWNLHGFLTNFLRHRDFPMGPLLLRDLLGSSAVRGHASHKHARISEVLELHPDLSFVLIGDSGQYDPRIYADVVRRNPGRILAVYIREVRLDPGDRRVEAISDTWDEEVPFVLAADSAAVAVHAAGLGLIPRDDVRRVEQATSRSQD
jgi:phosphatidate phosphatase APP1